MIKSFIGSSYPFIEGILIYFTIMTADLLSQVRQAYEVLPEVSCQGCGECCVSPTCFLSEFIYLIVHAQKELAPEDFRDAILSQTLWPYQ